MRSYKGLACGMSQTQAVSDIASVLFPLSLLPGCSSGLTYQHDAHGNRKGGRLLAFISGYSTAQIAAQKVSYAHLASFLGVLWHQHKSSICQALLSHGSIYTIEMGGSLPIQLNNCANFRDSGIGITLSTIAAVLSSLKEEPSSHASQKLQKRAQRFCLKRVKRSINGITIETLATVLTLMECLPRSSIEAGFHATSLIMTFSRIMTTLKPPTFEEKLIG